MCRHLNFQWHQGSEAQDIFHTNVGGAMWVTEFLVLVLEDRCRCREGSFALGTRFGKQNFSEDNRRDDELLRAEANMLASDVEWTEPEQVG